MLGNYIGITRDLSPIYRIGSYFYKEVDNQLELLNDIEIEEMFEDDNELEDEYSEEWYEDNTPWDWREQQLFFSAQPKPKQGILEHSSEEGE